MGTVTRQKTFPLGGPLSEGDFLRGSDDYSAMAEVADVQHR